MCPILIPFWEGVEKTLVYFWLKRTSHLFIFIFLAECMSYFLISLICSYYGKASWPMFAFVFDWFLSVPHFRFVLSLNAEDCTEVCDLSCHPLQSWKVYCRFIVLLLISMRQTTEMSESASLPVRHLCSEYIVFALSARKVTSHYTEKWGWIAVQHHRPAMQIIYNYETITALLSHLIHCYYKKYGYV